MLRNANESNDRMPTVFYTRSNLLLPMKTALKSIGASQTVNQADENEFRAALGERAGGVSLRIDENARAFLY